MDTLWINFPKMGGRSLKASHLCRPLSVSIHFRNSTTPTTIMATSTRAKGLRMMCERSIMIWVGRGSLAPRDLNNFENTGTMKINKARKMTTITESTTAG